MLRAPPVTSATLPDNSQLGMETIGVVISRVRAV
jgi:hypothetical protein